MYKKLAIIIALLVARGIIFYPANTLAYNDKTTHPALTAEIVDFYNLSRGSNAITEEEKQWLMEGSSLEDTPPRWINHFYDPIYNRGWTGENAGNLSPETVRQWSDAVLFAGGPLPSTEWATNELAQEAYARYGGNRTWKRALDYWVEGDKKEAYITLGYILHLIEDAAVPDHARNDTHAEPIELATGDPGSPLEQYASQYSPANIKILQIADSLMADGVVPPRARTIGEYIVSMARYSNKYFFSKDTVNDTKYEFPKIVRGDGNFGYGLDENNSEFVLARYVVTKEAESYILDKNDESILSAYFSRLARQAVLHGAGVIELFNKEGADAIINKDYRLQTVDKDIVRLFNLGNFSFFGEMAKIINAAQSILQNFGGLTLAAYDQLVSLVNLSSTTIIVPDNRTAAPLDNPPAVIETGEAISSSEPTFAEPSRPVTPTPDSAAQAASADSEPAASAAPTDPSQEGSSASVVSSSANASPQASLISPPQPIASMSWGISSTPPPALEASFPASPPSATAPVLPAIENFRGEFNSGTLEIDFLWTPITPSGTPTYFLSDSSATSTVATTTNTSLSIPVPGYGRTFTYSLEARDADGRALSNAPTETIPVPDWFLVVQNEKTEESRTVSDNLLGNRYQLGTGFYGTIYALVLEGYLTRQGAAPEHIFDSHLELEEFLEATTAADGIEFYFNLNRTFPIADGKIFDRERKQVVFNGLNIPVQPNKYYSLHTSNDLQNTSIALSGSATRSTSSGQAGQAGFTGGGTATHNKFVFGAGTVTSTYPFYPFLQVVVQKDYPPQSPPSTPEITATNFDEPNLRLGLAWASSTDPDTTDNLIKYEFNYATSTGGGQAVLAENNWRAASDKSAAIALEFPDSYTIGVRAKDDFGNTSAVKVVNWNFPPGFEPLILSDPVNSASQDFVLSQGGAVQSIKVFTSNFETMARGGQSALCSLDLYEVGATSTVPLAHNDTPIPGGGMSADYAYRGFGCAGELTFTYASEPVLSPVVRYRWVFSFEPNHPSLGITVKFWGRSVDTACGEPCTTAGMNPFSHPSLVNARFEIRDGSGVLFSN